MLTHFTTKPTKGNNISGLIDLPACVLFISADSGHANPADNGFTIVIFPKPFYTFESAIQYAQSTQISAGYVPVTEPWFAESVESMNN